MTTGSHDRSDGQGVSLMLEGELSRDDASTEYVEFISAGARVKGEFHCSECGYGVTIYRELPVCPMCGNGSWEQSTWSPFTRGTAHFARDLY